jgi:uncharacterized protein (DUF302 family)
MRYTKTIRLPLAYDDAVPVVKDAFKAQGFGALTEIDVRATLHEKLGEDMEPYVIIGACNPGLARRALDAEREIGALLPCNVIVRQDHDGVTVDALDPAVMVTISDSPALRAVAEEAAQLIGAALDALVQAHPVPAG